MAHFDDVVMPNTVRFGSTSGPATSTQIAFTGGGFRKANQRWDQHLRRLTLSFVKSVANLQAVVDIFEVMEGPANSFLTRDWGYWHTAADKDMRPDGDAGVTAFDQPLRNTADSTFLADGTTLTFQMVKRYIKGSATHVRVIKKPQNGTIKVGVDGVAQFEGASPSEFEVDYSTGIVTFQTAPGSVGSPTAVAVTWGGAFYVPVAFVQDELPQTLRTRETSGLPSVPLVEVRL